MEYCLRSYSAYKYPNTLDSLFNTYFISQPTFYPISGSYESAESGNQLTIFHSKKIVQKIVKLYNSTYDRLIDNGQGYDERWAYINKKYSYGIRTGKFQKMTSEQLTGFLDDVNYHYGQMEWYQNKLKLATTEIDDIINEIGLN